MQFLRNIYSSIYPRDEQRISERLNEYLALDVPTLLAKLNHDLAPVTRSDVTDLIVQWFTYQLYLRWGKTQFPTIPIDVQSSQLRTFLRVLQHKVCSNGQLRAEIQDTEFHDELQLALVIEKALSVKSPVLAAALIVKIGINNFCGCENTASVNIG